MALSSQMARAGMGRRYMSSRRRRKPIGRWGLGLLVVVAVGLWWWWPGSETTPKSDPATAPKDKPRLLSPARPSQTIAPKTPGAAVLPVPKPAGNQTGNFNQALSPGNVRPDTGYAAPVPAARRDAATPIAAVAVAKPSSQGITEASGNPSLFSPDAAVTATADRPLANGPLADARRLVAQGQLVKARDLLNDLLANPDISPAHAQRVRDELAQINQTLIFSARVAPEDPLVEYYRVQSGDLLSSIAPRYRIPYQLIEAVNGVSARRIRVGQRLKMIKGPFHAVVHKHDYRMDLFLNKDDDQSVYIRSFRVGLGEDNSTPVGTWLVRSGGRVANPGWTNPRTGKVYAPADPENPIGEHWIGLEGNDEHTRGLAGYGIHGTIEPDSIGRQVSMGCVRLRPEDIAQVYGMLLDGTSTVTVRP